MTRKSTLLSLTAVGLAGALLLSACSTENTGTEQGEDHITWAILGENLFIGTHLDPHQSQLNVSASVQRGVLDSLVFLDPASGQIQPWLAKSWQISDDGLEYTFQLREDVVFHDGESLNAEAVKANFDHVQNPATASAKALEYIGGDQFLGAEVVSEYEVKLKLSAPFAPLLANLSTTFLGIYSPVTLATHSKEQLGAGGPDVSVGSGPFLVKEQIANQQIVLERNDAYQWAPEGFEHQGPAASATITIRIVPDEAGRIGALQTGEAQLASNIPSHALNQLSTDFDIHRIANPGQPHSLFLNWGHGLLADPLIREALSIGFDLDAAVQGAFGGEYARAWSALSPTMGDSYDASLENSWQYNPERAGQLLDEAGWAEIGADGIRIKDGERLSVSWLAWQPFPEDRHALVNFITQDLAEIGIELVFSAVPGPEYQSRYSTGGEWILDFDITDWSYTSLDADSLRNHLHSEGYQNVNIDRLYDADLDALLLRAASTTDQQERAELYRQVQQWNAQQHAIIPLYIAEVVSASSQSVEGLVFDSFGAPLLYGASLKQ